MRFPAREVWSVHEILGIAAALAIDALPAERRAMAKLLAALSVPLPEIRAALDVAIVETTTGALVEGWNGRERYR